MRDLRMPLVGAGAWCGGLLAALAGPGTVVAMLLGGALAASLLHRRGLLVAARLATVAVVAAAGVAGVAELHARALSQGPVAALAAERAVVSVDLEVTSDPRPTRTGGLVLWARVVGVVGRGAAHRVSTPVVVLAGESWNEVELGSRVSVWGRLAPADGDVAGLLLVQGEPRLVAEPDVWWRGAAVVRRAIRDAVADRDADARALVPSLVMGDDAGMDPELAEDFRTTGLTHLLAVSGTNLTLLVGFLLVLARWLGVRGRWLQVVAAAGIVGFVLVARTEPSVVRAAAMGTVALIALGSNGRERGARCLGVAVLGLLLVDPGLAVSVGFALSVLATAGILLLAPAWRDAMRRWLPEWAAAAVAVPAAAQLACTPVIAAISGQVSLVAVAANLAAAPAVAPVTVLGLAGGLAGLVWDLLGALVAAPAAWSAGWIVLVARQGASLPTAAIGWGTGPLALVVLTVLCLSAVWWAPRLLRRPVATVGCCVLVGVVVLSRPPTPGWPAEDWLLAACDVGQGDALVLRAGPQAGVVVDTGPEPEPVDRCLARLGVDRVPVLVLTHFHADHVGGLPGVLAGRSVGRVLVAPLPEPRSGAEAVARRLAAAGVTTSVARYGRTRRVGEVTMQVVGPVPGGTGTASAGLDGEGSPANNASVVVLAEVGGLRVLLTGDVEPPAQAALAQSLVGLEVDVLKVPHHGSSHQDLDFLTGLHARLALVSVGRNNDYGHPAPSVLAALQRAGTQVRRTDARGDLLVVVREGRLLVADRGG